MQMSKAENACPETNGQRRPWKICIFCWLKGECWRVPDWNKSFCTESCEIGFERSSRNERGSGQETCPKQLKAMLELWESHGIGYTQKISWNPGQIIVCVSARNPSYSGFSSLWHHGKLLPTWGKGFSASEAITILCCFVLFPLPRGWFSLLTQSQDLPCSLHTSQPSVTLQFTGHHPLQFWRCSRQGKTLSARTPESREKGKSS